MNRRLPNGTGGGVGVEGEPALYPIPRFLALPEQIKMESKDTPYIDFLTFII
jgi:hypothetical protein